MTTTELIELLKGVEFGASGRAREISVDFVDNKDKSMFFYEPKIEIDSTGDGVAGAELSLRFEENK